MKTANLLTMRYSVRRLDGQQAREYIKRHHYSHSCHGRPWPCFGLYEGDDLLGVCLFANSCGENVRSSIFGVELKNSVIELHRFFLQDETLRFAESWFLSRCLKELRKARPETKAVISFSDPAAGHPGIIYRATNALFYGFSRVAIFYLDQEGRLRHPRQRGHNVTLAEAEALGWQPIKRPGKYRYLFLVGGPLERRQLRRSLRVTILPYDKSHQVGLPASLAAAVQAAVYLRLWVRGIIRSLPRPRPYVQKSRASRDYSVSTA